MGQIGLGVMIQSLGGNAETVSAVTGSIGKTIARVWLEDETLKFEFSDGTKMNVWDGGQSCCESRYMVTADDLSEYAGAILMDMELKDAPEVEDEYGSHEVQFLDVKTDKGVFQMASHNEHNGYYGGFWIQASIIPK